MRQWTHTGTPGRDRTHYRDKALPVYTENLNPDVVVMKSAKDRM
jgi:hypothetical protein